MELARPIINRNDALMEAPGGAKDVRICHAARGRRFRTNDASNFANAYGWTWCKVAYIAPNHEGYPLSILLYTSVLIAIAIFWSMGISCLSRLDCHGGFALTTTITIVL